MEAPSCHQLTSIIATELFKQFIKWRNHVKLSSAFASLNNEASWI